jgi:hypothetical protein
LVTLDAAGRNDAEISHLALGHQLRQPGAERAVDRGFIREEVTARGALNL